MSGWEIRDQHGEERPGRRGVHGHFSRISELRRPPEAGGNAQGRDLLKPRLGHGNPPLGVGECSPKPRCNGSGRVLRRAPFLLAATTGTRWNLALCRAPGTRYLWTDSDGRGTPSESETFRGGPADARHGTNSKVMTSDLPRHGTSRASQDAAIPACDDRPASATRGIYVTDVCPQGPGSIGAAPHPKRPQTCIIPWENPRRDGLAAWIPLFVVLFPHQDDLDTTRALGSTGMSLEGKRR